MEGTGSSGGSSGDFDIGAARDAREAADFRNALEASNQLGGGGSARAQDFANFLGRYGLLPDDLMNIAQRSTTMKDYKEQIAEVMDSLGGWGKLGEFGRGVLGMKGLYDETGFYTPEERQALGAVGKGFATFGGLPGLLAARAMKGFTNIATDTGATARGVGFGLSDRGQGLGPLEAAAGGGGLPGAIARIRAQREALMQQTQQIQDLFTTQATQAAGV